MKTIKEITNEKIEKEELISEKNKMRGYRQALKDVLELIDKFCNKSSHYNFSRMDFLELKLVIQGD